MPVTVARRMMAPISMQLISGARPLDAHFSIPKGTTQPSTWWRSWRGSCHHQGKWADGAAPVHQRLPPARLFSQFVLQQVSTTKTRDSLKPSGTPQSSASPSGSGSKVDYCSGTEDGVLALPLTQELTVDEIQNVFGYPRHITHDYDLREMLGSGSFGTVFKAIEKETGHVYAIKTIPKKPAAKGGKGGKSTPRYLLKIQTEVEAMSQLGASLNAVFLKAVYEDSICVHLVMELCEGGALMEKTVRLSEQEAARSIRSILRFLAQCHAKGVIYRDVKADNFLYVTRDVDSPLKATDFGLAIRHWPQEGNLKSRSGTPAYMAPEVIMQDYGEKCDLWSTGILMYQMITGSFPFWGDIRKKRLQEVWKSILVDKLELDTPALRSAVSPQGLDLLKKLLVRDPMERISACEALEHPWIKELDDHPECHLCGTFLQRLQRFATYGRLKQMVLKAVAKDLISTQEQPVQELAGIFAEIDSDGSGKIDYSELLDGLRKQGYILSDEELQQLMSRMDMDGDGSIDFEELCTALLDWDELHTCKQFGRAVDATFSQLDIGNKGYLEPADLMILLPPSMNDADEHTREMEAKRMLREMDKNHQGRLHKPEFVGMLMESYAEDHLTQYDDRLHHEPTCSLSSAEYDE